MKNCFYIVHGLFLIFSLFWQQNKSARVEMKAEVSQTTFTTSRTATLYNILKQQLYTQQKFVKNHAILVITLNRPILSCHTKVTVCLYFPSFHVFFVLWKFHFHSCIKIASHFKLDLKEGEGEVFTKTLLPCKKYQSLPYKTF